MVGVAVSARAMDMTLRSSARLRSRFIDNDHHRRRLQTGYGESERHALLVQRANFAQLLAARQSGIAPPGA